MDELALRLAAKAAWTANKTLRSSKWRMIPATEYYPRPKAPSRRDLRRMGMGRKRSVIYGE